MSTWTKAKLASRVLEDLGVLAAGQAADAGDSKLVEDAIDSVYSILRRKGLCPFLTSAIPDWAQPALTDYVKTVIGPAFGRRMSFIEKKKIQEESEARLQPPEMLHPVPIRIRDF